MNIPFGASSCSSGSNGVGVGILVEVGKGVSAGRSAQLIRRTWLNDNDAGGKVKYANFTKKTGMLEKIRHYNPKTYRQLVALDKDLAAKGKLYAYLRETFGLTEAQLEHVVTGTHEAAAILRATCKAEIASSLVTPSREAWGSDRYSQGRLQQPVYEVASAA